MKDLIGCIVVVLLAALCILIVMCLSFGIVRKVQIYFNDIPCHAEIDGVTIFTGKKYQLCVSSSGATTQLKTYKGFLYLFPDKYYNDKNIKIKCGEL